MLQVTDLHENWMFAESTWTNPGAMLGFSALEWLPATVPGHVHLDLVNNGVIAHPFAEKHELGCQWVDQKSFVYRTEFAWTPSAAQPRCVLHFAGLDTICRISLNGKLIGEHDNMFVPLEIDVTAELVFGKNTLEISFDSAVNVGHARLAEYFSREGLNLEPGRFDERSFVRKAQYMFGWDWGPRLVSCGIWQKLQLLEFSARLIDVHVEQVHHGDGSVSVKTSSSFEGAGLVVHQWAEEQPVMADGVVAKLETPELWYPAGLGAQPLYELRSYLCPPDFKVEDLSEHAAQARKMLENIALDARVTRVGLRRLRLLQEPDKFGQSFEFEINGERLWAMGANWIPDHSFPSQVKRHELEIKLKAARDAGMNMLRIWGGGLYESDDFYELCDALGLLVWQDFPFACAYYPDTHEWPEIIAREARCNVRRLRNHPSLALWCGNNENLQMFEQRWGNAAEHPPRFYGEALYERVLREVVTELDSERPYVPGSPYAGETANSGGFGDQHYWDVWHGRGDWKHYRDSSARFSSEYGFASACSMKTWERVFPQSPAEKVRDLGVRNASVRWHDKTKKGYETFLGFVALHYPPPITLEDWVYYSQLNQRDAMRSAIEHYRRSEFCRGSLIWQLNDCWPVQSWALMDAQNQWKAAFYELFRLYATELLSLERSDNVLRVWAILDNAPRGRMSGRLVLTLHALCSGEVLRRQEASVNVANGERKLILEIPLADVAMRETLVVARFGERHAVQLLEEPKNLVLPSAGMLHISPQPGRLSVQTETPLVDVMFSDASGTGNFKENFLTIPTPGVFDVEYVGDGQSLEARSLAGKHPCMYYAQNAYATVAPAAGPPSVKRRDW